MRQNQPCELISWGRFQTLSRALATSVRQSGYTADMIVAIGRGGYMPARLLSDYLGIMNLTSFKIEHYRGARKHAAAVIQYPLSAVVQDKRVLLVDDVSDSGDTFTVAVEHIMQCGSPAQIRTAVLHHKITSRFIPDYYARKIVKWRWLIYPWAVSEDIASFIAAEITLPAPIDGIVAQINARHGIRVSPRQVEDALALLQENVATPCG